MASIIKRLWSGSDFWDKEENKQQRQQFIQDTKPTPGPSILSTVHNTINDTLNANTQADQQRRLSQGLPRYYQDQSNLSKITRAAETGGRVTARVLQGIGQDAAGAYDLLTPGHGTNRATKYYQNRGKETDQEVKDMGLDENVYKVGQVPLAASSYLIPGKVVSNVGKIPRVAKAATVLTNGMNKVPGLTKAVGTLDDLAANGNRFQRITANLARSYTRPGNIADVGVDALQNAGHRTSLGQDNSAGTLALDAGMSLGMQGGMNLAGQGASAVIRAANAGIVQPTTRLVRNVANTVAPVQTTTKLIPRTGRLDLATSDALKAYNNMLVGADPNIQGKVQSDLIARIQQIGKENGVDLTNGSVEQRMARVEAMLNGYLPQTQTGRQFVGKPLGEGGYAKNPFYRGDDVAGGKNVDPLESLKQEARKYKSAEEFVYTLGKLYRGGEPLDVSKIDSSGLPMTTSEKVAQYYKGGKKNGVVEQYLIDPTAKIKPIASKSLKTESDRFRALAQAEKEGFDGINLVDSAESEFRMSNSSKLLTDKQLTDLYNQAHSQPTPKAEAPDPLESLKQEARKYKSAEEFVNSREKLYHGSNKSIDQLKPGGAKGNYGENQIPGIYTTPDQRFAQWFAEVNGVQLNRPKELYASLKNPLEGDNIQQIAKKLGVDAKNTQLIADTARAKGHDGIVLNKQTSYKNGSVREVIPFESSSLLSKQQLTDLYNQATQSQPPKSTLVQKVAKADHWTTPLPDDGKRPPITAKDTNGVIPKEGDVIEFPGALGGKGRTTVHWQGPVRANASGKEIPGQWIGNGVLREDSPIPFTVVERNGKPLAPQPTKGAKVSSDSQAKQTVRSSAPIEPSVSSRKTVSNQPQAAGTPQNAPQGNATSKAKQASRPVAKEIGTTQSVEKTTKARSQTTKATEQQSSQTKLAKRGEQELSVSYPDNTTNVVNKRGFTQSVKRSGEVSPTTQKNVSGEYNVRSTAKLAISADEFSKGNINKVTKEINSRLDVPTGKINDQDIADSIAVAKRLDAKGDFEQATQIYDKLAEHGTKGGQAIQAFSLLKNRSPDGLKFQAVKQLKKNGVKLTPVDERKLGTLIDGVRNTKPGSEARDRAIYNTFDFVSRKLPTSTPDKLVNLWRAGLLTAPRTTGGNILGNTTEALTREFWTNPVAVTTDKFFSLFTGKRTKTMAGGRAAGAKEGVARGIDYLKTGFDPRNTPNMKYDAPRRLNYKNKVVDTYVNGVYRWMGGQDQPFYYAAKAAAARDLAKADGINLGYKGKQLAEYVEKSVFDENWKPQTFKTAKDATEYGKYAVYQNETLLGSMAAGLKRGAKSKSKGGGALADFILPFTQVPSSVAMRIVDRTPIGMAKEVVSQIKNKSFDQRAMSEAIANGSFGIPVLGAGYALANSGLITGAYPTDSKERKLWEAEGKQPYSVRIGDKWYSLNYMQPFGTVLSMGKQVSDDIKEGKSQAEAWMNATAAAAKSIESQSFLQGINGLLSAVHDPQRSMQQYANSTVSGIVPNFVRAGAMAIDPNQRETKNVGDALKGAIPGVRQTLNTKLDMFGNDLPARDTPLNQYLNPLRPSKVRNQDDPLVGELRRLQNTDNGIIPTQFNRKSIGGVDLSNEQVRELNQKVNNAVQQVWGQAINDPRYNAMDDGEKKRTLDKLKDQIAENAKAQFVTDNGIQTTSKYNSKPVTFPSSSNSRTSYKEKYDNLVAEFNDPNNGWSDVQKVAKTKELKRLEIKKDYDADTVALHDMSKADMYAYVSKAKNGKQLAEKLIAYDNALYEAGLSQYRKYKNGIAPASKGGGRKSGGRGGKRKAIPKDLMAKAMDVPKVAQLRQSKITAKQPQARSFKTRRKAIPKIAKSTPKLTVKRTQTA